MTLAQAIKINKNKSFLFCYDVLPGHIHCYDPKLKMVGFMDDDKTPVWIKPVYKEKENITFVDLETVKLLIEAVNS